ncbi:hypothetical protein ACS0TY_022466 [Phlomoides rotata]
MVESLDTTLEWTTWRDNLAVNIIDHRGNVRLNVERAKNVRGRRSWTKVEEDALINYLTDVVNDGWKAENGFKVGFQRELEKGMRKTLSGTDIVANLYINSNIHVWKKEYGELTDLLSKSGIGWNSTTYMIEVEDESVWKRYRRADPHLKVVHFKTWSATGENAVDPTDLANDLAPTGFEAQGETGEKFVPGSPNNTHDVEDNIIYKPITSIAKTVSKGKKRKSSDLDLAMLVETLGDFMKHSKDAIGDV